MPTKCLGRPWWCARPLADAKTTSLSPHGDNGVLDRHVPLACATLLRRRDGLIDFLCKTMFTKKKGPLRKRLSPNRSRLFFGAWEGGGLHKAGDRYVRSPKGLLRNEPFGGCVPKFPRRSPSDLRPTDVSEAMRYRRALPGGRPHHLKFILQAHPPNRKPFIQQRKTGRSGF